MLRENTHRNVHGPEENKMSADGKTIASILKNKSITVGGC
jgi:hypothetical protein